jgi:large subunit ribosomal protein L4
MIELPVYDRQGSVVETLNFDETVLGTFINYPLLHEAIVQYEANQRAGTAKTKDKREVTGCRTKPYRQKGTGRARMGHKRRVGSRGGAVAHGPRPRDFSKQMNKKARRAALRSALLGKLRDKEVLVLADLVQAAPKTSDVAKTLKAIKADGGCLVVPEAHNENVWKSLRNLPYAEVLPVGELNAYRVLRGKHLVITRAALEALQSEAN